MSSALPRAFSQRGKTQTEIERENFEKFQTISIQKAINSVECPVKEKHVRTAIIGTFQDGGASMFWSVANKLALQGNPIICWKFCYTLHKLLRDGHPTAIPESQKYIGKLTELGKLWGHLKDGYGKLIRLYTKLLNQKLAFHKKYQEIPGSLKLDDDEFVRIIGRDVDAQFEVSADLMDYMDDILSFQAGVFGSLDLSRSNSMTNSGQCRLAPLVQCILESALLYDYIVKILFKLHSSLPGDTLAGHRSRFSQQFTSLTKFFYSSKNLQYFKNLIQVPSLPETAPNFLIASELSQHARPMVVVEEEAPEVENLVDTHDTPPAVPDRFDSMARFSDDDKRDRHMHEMKMEIEHLKRRLRQLESDSHFELNQMTEEMRRKDKEVDTMKNLMKQMAVERDQILSEKQQVYGELDSRMDTAKKQAEAAEDKFKKMKEIYNKLREDHVKLLRTNGEVQKQVKKLSTDVQGKDEQIRELIGQVDLAKSERSMMQESVQQSGSDTELIEAKTTILQLEQEKQDLLDRFQSAQTAKSTAEEQVTKNEELVKELEMSKLNTETHVRELEETLFDLQTKESSLNDSVNLYQNKIAELSQREQTWKTNLAEAEQKFMTIKNDLDDMTDKHNQLTKDSRSEIERLKKQCLVECKNVVNDRMSTLENPSMFSLRCSAEFLIEILEPTIDLVNKLKEQIEAGDESWLSSVLTTVTRIADCVIFTKATSRCTTEEHSGPLSSLSGSLGECYAGLIDSLSLFVEDSGQDWIKSHQSVLDKLIEIRELTEKVRPQIKDVKAEEMGELVDSEMTSTTSAIEEATSHFEELLAQSRSKDSGVQLEVNERIIDSCTQLMQNIRVLIEKSRTLQKEIVAAGRGSSTVQEYYQKHSRWTEGLLSAAKSVAFGAKALLDSADKVVGGEAKFEELIVCSQEIAACTTQLVVASQVKADAQSKALQDVKKASSCVATSTGNVVAQAKSCAEIRDEQQLQDLTNVSLTQSKRMEMNSQVKVLELESALSQERVKLAALRKKHYQLAGESEGWEQEDIDNA